MSATWNLDPISDGANYTDNRRQGWGYDADGRESAIGTRNYNFDADGQMALMTGQQWVLNHYVNITQAMGYDGDGDKAKEVLSGQPTYYLKSSMLNDSIIEEINGSGQKNVGYVYTPEGQLLARQSGNQVTWKHTTPGGTGQYDTLANGSYYRVELDPMGADIGISAPEPPDIGGDEGDIGGNHFGGIMDSRWANLFDVSGGCSSLGYTAACHGVTSPDAYLQAQMRSFFGDRWFDLPGNNNELERGEAAYERMVSKAFAAYTERKNSQKKPKLKPAKNRTPQQREKAKREAQKRRSQDAGKGNSENEQPNIHQIDFDSLINQHLKIEHFTKAEESWIRYELKGLLTAECSQAFIDAKVPRTPTDTIVNLGLTIRPARDLANYSAAQLGLSEPTLLRAQSKISFGQAGTVFGVDGGAQTYLTPSAFYGASWRYMTYSLGEVLTHELVHGGGQGPWSPKDPRHDLKGFPGYENILERCRPQP